MAVCKFFQQGNCKFGDRCKFEHPGAGSGRRQEAPRNPFAPQTQSQGFAGRRGPSNYDSRQHGGRRPPYDNRDLPFHLNPKTIQEDLTVELPLWPLSAYGPGRDAPRQLIEGDIEQSPEEMRTLYYLAKLQNNVQPAIQDEQARAINATSQIEAILRDLDGACQYIVEGQQQHPNRWDVCRDTSSGPRGHNRQQHRAANFRNESRNPFNLSAQVGPPSMGAGAAPANPFGKPAPINPFGPPPTQATVNPFNTAPTAQPAAFGQPSLPGPQNPFGQPTAASPVNPFGPPAPPQPVTQQPVNPFGKPPETNGFGGAAKPQNPFGQPPGLSSSPFSAPQPFTASSPFQQPDATPAVQPTEARTAERQPNANPFGASAPGNGGFGSQPAGGLFSSRAPQADPAPRTNGFASAPARGPSQVMRSGGGPRKFAQPPEYYADTEAPAQDYGPEGSEKRRALEEAYRRANVTGRFEGPVPEEPPLHQWRDFDF